MFSSLALHHVHLRVRGKKTLHHPSGRKKRNCCQAQWALIHRDARRIWRVTWALWDGRAALPIRPGEAAIRKERGAECAKWFSFFEMVSVGDDAPVVATGLRPGCGPWADVSPSLYRLQATMHGNSKRSDSPGVYAWLIVHILTETV